MATILKAFMRSRESRTLTLIIILFTTLIVPFHTIVGHYQLVERLASKYLPSTGYILVAYPTMNKSIISSQDYVELPIYLMEAGVDAGDHIINMPVYSFGDIDQAKKILGINVAGLGVGECLVSREAAGLLGVSPGDELTIHIGDKDYVYRVKGYNNLFPIVIPEPLEPFYTFVVYEGAKDSLEGYGSSNVFDYGGYMGLVRGLRDEAQNILNIWGTPLLIITAIGIYIALLRVAVGNKETIGILRDMGFSRGGIYKYFLATYSILIVASTLVGISLGLVSSQVVARIIYVSYGLDITPVLSLSQFTTLLTGLIALGHITLILSLPMVGKIYGEAG